ncbi:MAG: ATP-dependent helicase [Victivallaceae bacterium]|nr:UvrD-helicase domain-containing protein [Victivallaceae bacterium]
MTAIDELLSGLNPEQREAVITIEGPLLVLAGAGTGKTKVITSRIAYMIASGVAPEHILGMTFTNKAAAEMRERLSRIIGEPAAAKVTLGTFHRFCARFLRREITRLGYLGNFTIADEQDQQGLLKQALAMAGFSKETLPLPAAAGYIGRQKNRALLPENADRGNRFESSCAAVYGHYQKLLELQNSVDFDDLLLLTAKILRDFPDVCEKYRNQYHYVLIDEYQDTNAVQFEIVQQLCEKRRNLCVVGDDDQSIYSWRGADVRNILDFPQLYPDLKQIKLEQNYRSTNNILDAANAVIAKSDARFSKNLRSNRGAGEPLLLVRASDDAQEAEFVASHILKLKAEQPDLKYRDFAILYRSNHLSRQLEITLRQCGVPYRLVGGQEFYQRKEIKDAAAYLKLLANPRDNQSLLRILALPPRGLADKAVTLMKEGAAKNIPMRKTLADPAFQKELPAKGGASAAALTGCFARYEKEFATQGNLAGKVASYLEDVGYIPGLQQIYRDIEDARKRRENIDEFISSVAKFEERNPRSTLADFLENFALLEENDRTAEPEANADTVTLSSVHAAKGLEFPCVFLVAAEEKLFPHERALEEGNLEEEKRLFYVALTRAKNRLIISAARKRMERGVWRDHLTSNFVKLLPDRLCEAARAEDIMEVQVSPDDLERQFENIFKMLK